ncbi:MAG: hypothetical protein GX571_10520 [Lentisphaerae bacterium]|nr:hypothetical protein [Lentisphaerota bacterium]
MPKKQRIAAKRHSRGVSVSTAAGLDGSGSGGAGAVVAGCSPVAGTGDLFPAQVNRELRNSGKCASSREIPDFLIS